MAGTVKTYNSRQVIITLGTHAVSGLADDSFVTIEEKGEGVLSKTGCDGEIARAIDPNKQYTYYRNLRAPPKAACPYRGNIRTKVLA